MRNMLFKILKREITEKGRYDKKKKEEEKEEEEGDGAISLVFSKMSTYIMYIMQDLLLCRLCKLMTVDDT